MIIMVKIKIKIIYNWSTRNTHVDMGWVVLLWSHVISRSVTFNEDNSVRESYFVHIHKHSKRSQTHLDISYFRINTEIYNNPKANSINVTRRFCKKVWHVLNTNLFKRYWTWFATLQAERVRAAAWGCDWVGTPLPFTRSLSFVIKMANKDIMLTAGKFVPVSKATMMNVRIPYYWIKTNLWNAL
jgi:hypothetical protein